MTCPACKDLSADGLLCRRCTTRCRKDLEKLPELWWELEITQTRQSQAGTGVGGRGATSPLPFDGRASDARDSISNTISTWVRELDMGDTEHLASNFRAWCRWLGDRIQRIRGHVAAGEIADELSRCVALARRVIDPHGGAAFAGPCEVCGGDIYGPRGGQRGTCRKCGLVVDDLEMRWARIAVQAEDAWVDKRTMLAAVPSAYGVELSDTRFRKWTSRGKLTGRIRIVRFEANRPVVDRIYRVGDVTDLINAHATRQRAG